MTDTERCRQAEEALRAIFLRAAVVLEVDFLRTYDRDRLLGVIEEIRDMAWVALGPPLASAEK